jgi:indole-3-glycerol phosphate synthase
MDKLREIIEHKKVEIQRILPLADKLRFAAAERNEYRSLEAALDVGPNRLGLIAEVKKASPSVGVIAENFDPVEQALAYARAGASAISVLTDEKYFQGRLDYLVHIRQMVDIPLLRKDFIIDPVQIYEAAVVGADAILLIVAALAQDDLKRLLEVAHNCQLEVLMEVHDLAELDRALETDARIIGVNNRNLKTFEVDLATTEALSEEVPDDHILVSESGIKTPDDARRVHRSGADAILVGEALMRSADVAVAVRDLMDAPMPAEE